MVSHILGSYFSPFPVKCKDCCIYGYVYATSDLSFGKGIGDSWQNSDEQRKKLVFVMFFC